MPYARAPPTNKEAPTEAIHLVDNSAENVILTNSGCTGVCSIQTCARDLNDGLEQQSCGEQRCCWCKRMYHVVALRHNDLRGPLLQLSQHLLQDVKYTFRMIEYKVLVHSAKYRPHVHHCGGQLIA